MKLIFVIAGLVMCCATTAQVRLPQLVRDSMVLQRDAKINIWGWAAPGEKVSVKFNGKTVKATTGADGKWNLQLPPIKAGGPYTMNVDASNHIVLKDILIGDVWICSGQSNMVHQMALHSVRYADEIATANYPQIRHFWIPTITDLQEPHDDLPSGSWKWANPQDVLQFSAVAYFFAKALYQKYGVPIGLINASVGGTPIEAWISEEGLKEFPDINSTIVQNKDTAYIDNLSRKSAAGNNTGPQTEKDKGLTGMKSWYDTAYIPKGWRTINIPGYWEDQGIKELNGIVWYRREMDIPAAMVSVPATVFLGRIVDADVLYINGKKVSNTTYQYPQRRYTLPTSTLKKGKNIFVIQVQNNSGKGGFIPDKPYYIATTNDTIDLKGTWAYKVGEVYTPQPFSNNTGIAAQNQPNALYNAMVAPLINYTAKGFAWYQGETNTGNPQAYAKLLPALIHNWRAKWKQPAAPFIYVQLPGYMDVNYLPSESSWAVLREAQLQALSVPNTGMAIAIDLGEWNDVHPDRKKEVGDRLALVAAQVAYGEKDIVATGPLYKSATIEGNKIILSFTNTGSGLISNDDEELSQFAIAGNDKKFVWAKAVIEGNMVVVSSPDVPNPMYVRYAWADNPDGANLYNREGLPASPFRTDK